MVIPFDAGNNESLNFQPQTTKVVLGNNNTIVWVNNDPLQHTVKSSSAPAGAQGFDSGILNQGQSFTITLTAPGTYHYYCTIHPTWMKGTIQVIP
ncbi:MAG: plastocyanin/azurin family copper-binding protein [Nitrososphaerales archaeon]|nr:plastocyanin/azurin family copper-binding protein [Nitrososphaerales archaeon]